MPQYNLEVVENGSLQSTGYTLQITGSSASSVNVKYSQSSSGPWTDFGGTATFTPATGKNGTPSSPQPGDQLLLSGTVGDYSLSGTDIYAAGTDSGYERGSGVSGDESDWAAPSN